MKHGARFFKCDLHIHTPADSGRWLGSRMGDSESEKRSAAMAFIKRCYELKLEIIAVTDHNFVSRSFIAYLTNAAEELSGRYGYRLALFPGFEIKADVGKGIHVLGIFDPSTDLELIEHCLTKCGVPYPRFEFGNPVTSQKRLSDILEAVQEKVEGKSVGLVILPHSQADAGIFDSDQIAEWLQMEEFTNPELLCVEVPKPVSAMSIGWQRLFQAGDDCLPEWRRQRPIAFIMSSDAKALEPQEAANYIGFRHSWIKLGSPSVEGLRQAFLSHESRICLTEPRLPLSYIYSMEVGACKFFLDRPLRFGLNPQFNAIIGGRGTGKSTLLEYVRWALCDQPLEFSAEDEMLAGEIPQFAIKRGSIIRDTLLTIENTDPYVRIKAIINGSPHQVTRYARDDRVLLKIGDDEEYQSNADQIRALFPIQAYSQKQLSTVSVRSEELRRIIQSPIQEQIQYKNQDIKDHAVRLRALFQRIWQDHELSVRAQKLASQERSIRAQIEHLRGDLLGLPPEERGILDSHDLYLSEERLLSRLDGDLNELSKILEDAKQKVIDWRGKSTDLDALPNKRKMLDLISIIRTCSGEFLEAFEHELTRWKERRYAFELIKTEIDAQHSLHNKAYEEAITRAAAYQEKIKEIEELSKRAAGIKHDLEENQKARQGLQVSRTEEAEEVDLWVRLHRLRGDLLERECQALVERSGGDIRAHLKRGGDVQKAIDSLRTCCEGAHIREDWLDALKTQLLTAEDPASEWISVLNELRGLAELWSEEQEIRSVPSCPNLRRSGFTDSALRRIASQITREVWLDLFLISLDDLPEVQYCVGPEIYIPFANASPGQQATGLLRVLLQQEGGPLLIDQPEEDLDNANIERIVTGIWDAKRRRQILMISHNANLVVNGDAELIIHCDYRSEEDRSSGKIAAAGSIDETHVRRAITRVMEGGEKAFELRRVKYGF